MKITLTGLRSAQHDFSAVFVEADDGSVAIANSDFSLVMEGQYLTADEAIDYMGAAANYIN